MPQDSRVVVSGITPSITAQSNKQELKYDAIHNITLTVLANCFEPIMGMDSKINLDFENKGETEKEIINIQTEYTANSNVGAITLNTAIYTEDQETEQIIRSETPGIKVAFLPSTERFSNADDETVQEQQKCIKNAEISVYGDVDVNYNFIHRVKDPIYPKDACNKDYVNNAIRRQDLKACFKTDGSYNAWHIINSGYVICRVKNISSEDILNFGICERAKKWDNTNNILPYTIITVNKINNTATFTTNGFSNNNWDTNYTISYSVFSIYNTICCFAIVNDTHEIWIGKKENINADASTTVWNNITSLFNNAPEINSFYLVVDLKQVNDIIYVLISSMDFDINTYNYGAEFLLQIKTDFQTPPIITDLNTSAQNIVVKIEVNQYRILLYKIVNYDICCTDLTGTQIYANNMQTTGTDIMLTYDDKIFTRHFLTDSITYMYPVGIYYDLQDTSLIQQRTDLPIKLSNSECAVPTICTLPYSSYYELLEIPSEGNLRIFPAPGNRVFGIFKTTYNLVDLPEGFPDVSDNITYFQLMVSGKEYSNGWTTLLRIPDNGSDTWSNLIATSMYFDEDVTVIHYGWETANRHAPWAFVYNT